MFKSQNLLVLTFYNLYKMQNHPKFLSYTKTDDWPDFAPG